MANEETEVPEAYVAKVIQIGDVWLPKISTDRKSVV